MGGCQGNYIVAILIQVWKKSGKGVLNVRDIEYGGN